MNKNRQNKALAAVLATSILVTGTFAWQSFSQLATNETITKGGIAGGRLHDYFFHGDEETYDRVQQVFVENYAKSDSTNPNDITADIFARVRLSEYMEIGLNAGYLTGEDADKLAAKEVEIVRGATTTTTPDINDQTTWDIYKLDNNSAISQYRTLAFGGDGNDGKTVYLPTYNQDHTNNDADTNGKLGGLSGDRHNEDTAYNDYVLYVDGETVSNTTDASAANGELTYLDETLATPAPAQIATPSHEAKETLATSDVISMADWLALDNAAKIGPMWVFDTDGWAYWAQPITANTATGLLLAGINEVKTEEGTSTYYAVHAEAQLATAGDWGDKDSSELDKQGMYANNELTADGEFLLTYLTNEIEVFTQPTTTLTALTGLSTSEVVAKVGTEETVVVDNIEYYVLDRKTIDKYYTEELKYGTVDSVLLWSEDLVDVNERYKNINEAKGMGDHQVNYNNYNSFIWEISDMRNEVLVDWLEASPQANSLTLTNEITTSLSYYTDSTAIPTTIGNDVITYDRAFLLSQPEYLGYEINLDDRYKAATINQFADDLSFATQQYYWLRSGFTYANLRIVNAATGTFHYTNALINNTYTNGVGVRPAIWVAL